MSCGSAIAIHRIRSLLRMRRLFPEQARSYADLPGGHSEGYDDTFKQVFRRFYRTVADRNATVEYPTFEDGMRQLRVLDAVLASSQKRAWADVG
jgi:predicted dehydrogenase